MKRIIAVVISLIIAACFTGCANDVTLTQEENDLVAEYVAGKMLKHAYAYQWEYSKLNNPQSSVLQEPIQQETDTQQPSNNNTNQQIQSSDNVNNTNGNLNDNPLELMSKSLGLGNTAIAVKRCLTVSNYPEGEYAICVPASDGNVIFAIEFEIVNKSGSIVTLNTLENKFPMKLRLNDRTFYEFMSILKNDFNNIDNVKLDPGEKYTAVVLFQIDEELANQTSGSVISVYQGLSSIGDINID